MSKSKVKPYQSEKGDKKEQVGKMFDNIAPTYDLLNRVLTLGIDQRWRKKLVSGLSHLKKGDKVLDMATGTADVAIGVSKNNPDLEVVGIDLSVEMIGVGNKKLKKYGLTEKITLTQGDAESIAFSDNTFSACTVAFGVRNFGDLEKGLAEINRVLNNNGTLIVLEFSRPKGFVFKNLYNIYFKYLLPLLGKLKSGDPKAYDYLYRSVQKFPDGKDFLNVLERNGFDDLKEEVLTFGICTLYTGKKVA